MKKGLLLFIVLMSGFTVLLAQDTLIVQENAPGQCTIDGVVMTNLSGWTGAGYIDALNGVGTTVSWEIMVPADGIYSFSWRYAFGGTATNYRDAKLVIDGNTAIDTVYFPYTTTWLNWALLTPVNINLTAGDHKIRLEAVRTGGIANLDYFMVIGTAPTAALCTPQYTVNVSSDSSAWGSVWFTPTKTYYDKGTTITLHANANPGYFFESWLGEATSNDSVYTFTIKSNVNAIARFLPNGTVMDPNLIGYAGVQDDSGTTYMVFGGALGDTIEAKTISDLKTYLGDSSPHIVKFAGEFVGPDTIFVKSNKTFLGIDSTSHLRNIEVRINQARNVILRNITVSHVHPKDAFAINDKSQNIFIDHCEAYSQRGDNDGNGIGDEEADKDWYDGLLDIKNQSSFITVSGSSFHDHYKVCLMASNDAAFADSIARITFHHNYFFNCSSRLPMIRFGKAHIFNNYYKDCHNAVDSRMGAWVRVEGNYFDNVYNPVFDQGSAVAGRAQLIDNIFANGSGTPSLPVCDLQVPYLYTLDPTADIPAMITNGVRTDVDIHSPTLQPKEFALEQNYPNPFNPVTKIDYTIPSASYVTLKIVNLLGQVVVTLVDEKQEAQRYTKEFDATRFSSGIYFYQINAGKFSQTKKMILLK
jgi:pectate lyase